jgi:hypothetical protein
MALPWGDLKAFSAGRPFFRQGAGRSSSPSVRSRCRAAMGLVPPGIPELLLMTLIEESR